jgi:hypothetical protein
MKSNFSLTDFQPKNQDYLFVKKTVSKNLHIKNLCHNYY